MTIPDPMEALKASLPPTAMEHFDRMELLQSKFYPTEREDRLASAFEEFMRKAVKREDTNAQLSYENRGKGRGLVLHGPTRVGKSTSLDRMLDNNSAFKGWRDPKSNSPLLAISLASPCTNVTVGRQLVSAASGLIIHGDPPAHKLFEIAAPQLVARKKAFLRLEELQHATHEVAESKQQVLADALKNLMEIYRINLIISGVDTLLPFLQLDSQLLTRLTVVPFPYLTPEDLDMIEDMVVTYAEALDLTVDTGGDPDFYPRVSQGALHALGLAIEMTLLALTRCLQTGAKTLTIGNFAEVYAARTGAPASRNPFVADCWWEIDCSKILPPKPIAAPASPVKRPPGKG
jgi:hypothetical protein